MRIELFALISMGVLVSISITAAYGQSVGTEGYEGPDQNENETTTTMTAEAWKTCEDPILQISIECPTNWSMGINEDGYVFEPADVPRGNYRNRNT